MNPSNKPHPPSLAHGRTPAGKNVPIHVDDNGDLSITATVTGADGAILDGANNAVKATVKDYTNSNPLAVITVDTNGDPTGGAAVSIADGADVAEGATTDVAVTGDNAGTVKAALRGLGKIFADVWDSTNHWLKVSIQNTSIAITAAALPLPSGASTSANQTNASQKTQVVDGAGNVVGSTGNALDINIKSGNPTSITANAGTNLNTSALALESGGNLATVAGAVRAEDAASADGHTGVGALAVRKATPANTSGTDGDYEFLQISVGRLWTSAQVYGDVAHDGVDSGNPVKVGSRAVSFGANPTGVSAADRADQLSCVAGVPFYLNAHPNIITRRDNYTGAQTDTAIVTVAGGTKIVIVSCTVTADAANTAKPAVRVGFGATNTPTAGGTYLSHPGVPAGGGVREAGAVAGADGEDIRITCAAPTGGSIDVVTKYFTIES